jgi:hypothetical protein
MIQKINKNKMNSAVSELEKKLLSLDKVSYDIIDNIMRKIMKSHNLTAKELHNAFVSKNKSTPDNWIKKMKRINEDHKEISSGKKADDEGYMARSELDSIERAVGNLRKTIKSGKQQLPAWVQSKITKAADYIDTAAEYLQSDETVDENISFEIGSGHREVKKQSKIRKLVSSLNPNEAKVANSKLRRSESLPSIKKEEISLVEKILGEEMCGKGMYWCNTDKKCKPMPTGMKVPGQKIKPTEVGIGKPVAESCNHSKKGKSCPVHGQDACPMSEERDPKGPTKAYKSPEEISKKHGVSLEHINKQLEIGTKVEFEHTTSKSAARITALQHLDEKPDYYTKLKKMESQKESVTIEDMYGNSFVEFIDLISADPIKIISEEDPCWKGYTQVGMKKKGGKEVPNCVPSKGVPKAKGYKKESLDEVTRIQAQNGNIISVTLSWRGKYYALRTFFPQTRLPSRKEVNDEIQKIYPGAKVVAFGVSDLSPGQPLLQIQNSKSKNYLLNNKNIGEGVEIEEEKKSEMPCNKPKAQAHGSGETGKSHVVKACDGGKEKLIRFGQLGVKGSPKKKGESEDYASRRHRFQTRHAKNIEKGKMSAAYWANKVKW